MIFSNEKYGWGYDGIYQYIVESLSCDKFKSHEVGDYQGDSIVFFKKGSKFGILNHAYGSCSGCDSYQACENSEKELANLAEAFKDSVVWYDSAEEFIDYCENKWLEGDAGYHIHDNDYVEIYKSKARCFVEKSCNSN